MFVAAASWPRAPWFTAHARELRNRFDRERFHYRAVLDCDFSRCRDSLCAVLCLGAGCDRSGERFGGSTGEPLGIVLALAAHRLLARYDSLLVHALGAFVAGAATGTIVAIIASPLLAPIGQTLAQPALTLMIAGIFALLGGASAAAGWRIAFAISR